MNTIRWIVPVLLTVIALQPVRAQEVRAINTQIVKPSGAPLQIDKYEATTQVIDDGFSTLAFLKEEVTLRNLGSDRIAAVEVQILYLGAFGELIDSVSETIIRELTARATVVETFRSPLSYTLPIYTAVVYPSQVRIEPSGMPERATIWRADSTDVVGQLRRLVGDVTLAQGQ